LTKIVFNQSVDGNVEKNIVSPVSNISNERLGEEDQDELVNFDINEIDFENEQDYQDEFELLSRKKPKKPIRNTAKKDKYITKRVVRQATIAIYTRGIDYCRLLFSRKVCKKAMICLAN
jgi:hypothetical protein